MTIDEVLQKNGVDFDDENIMVFRNPEFSEAAIGITLDNNVVYDYSRMIESLMKEDNMTEEEATDFLDYNTLRVIPYMAQEGKEPIIIRSFENGANSAN